MSRSNRKATNEIIDIHTHMNPFWRLDDSARETLIEHSVNFERKERLARNPELFLEYLDTQNVGVAGIINYVSPILGYTHETNDWAAAFRDAAPNRILAFGGFDPRMTDTPEEIIEHAVEELHLDGIKIHPPHQGINANDYRDDPDTRNLSGLALLYEKCAMADIPIMVHTGTSIFNGARSRYADPMPIDDVAVDYPDLDIIMAHGGRPLHTDEAWFLLRRHENVYLDISSFPPQNLLTYFPEIEDVGDRVLFGSDWPGPMIPDISANAATLQELDLSEDVLDGILRTNAAGLFSL